MDILVIILKTIVVIIALLLIALVLVQQSKGGGFGSAFGGTGDVFGAHAGTHLTRLTVVLASLFLIFTLGLAIIIGHTKDKGSDFEDKLKKESKTELKTGDEGKEDEASIGGDEKETEEKKEGVEEKAE